MQHVEGDHSSVQDDMEVVEDHGVDKVQEASQADNHTGVDSNEMEVDKDSSVQAEGEGSSKPTGASTAESDKSQVVLTNPTSIFAPMDYMYNYLGVVRKVRNKEGKFRAKVRLMTVGDQCWEGDIEFLERLATEDLVKEASKDCQTMYDKGDIVVVKDEPRINEIKELLKKQGVVNCSYADTLVGQIVGKGDHAHQWNVQFANSGYGCFKLNSSQLALVKSSNVPETADIALGQFPLKLQTNDKDLLKSKLVKVPGVVINDSDSVSDIWKKEVIFHQGGDPQFGPIVKFLIEKVPITSTSKSQMEIVSEIYVIKDDILYHKTDRVSNSLRLCVPMDLREVILYMGHDLTNHFDWKKTYHTIQRHYFFLGMCEVTRRYVGSCYTCQMSRNISYFQNMYGPSLPTRVNYWEVKKLFFCGSQEGWNC